MRRLLPCLLVPALLAAAPAAARAADRPSDRTLYADGHVGRYLLDGEWLFRLDPQDTGLAEGLPASTSRDGWAPATVPSAWNAGDDSPASNAGGVGWYRKDFELPDARRALRWIVRFESVNYRTTVWLNGREIGSNTGAYLPFELVLAGVRPRGTNRLVVRVDSRLQITDFPPYGQTATGIPAGGWWNYGGIIREVYLRRVDTVDFADVLVRPTLRCPTCDARVEMSAAVRNATRRRREVTVSGRFGTIPVELGTQTVAAGATATFARRFVVRNPRLWSPARPNLYDVSLSARAGEREAAGYALHSGIRSITVTGGRLRLNGRPVNFRGVGFHEDDKALGFAIDNAVRDRLVAESEAIGATLMRTHYPPHPYLHELADREGILLWSEVPVYSLSNRRLGRPAVRAAAVDLAARNVQVNRNHPSVLTWSIANELDAIPNADQVDYINRAAAVTRELDPTRPVSIALLGYINVGCQAPAYEAVDFIGINDYFGWYPGPGGSIFDPELLPGYLDAVRDCFPDKAIAVTEFGAEANRDGPVEEKGTWAAQEAFANYHLGVYATKPWLSGASYWALNEFRIHPGWEGGNPRPQPPIHQKGLLMYGTWQRKPAWNDVRRWYARTPQYVRARGARRG
ncbi:MAG TPA: glycoside hydrolase family 2 TIM barrel-domain containing protein [Solirubrobacteraceae bacterium]|nr:glycoside hydrolase family 2 TIM barrel-domain containing protein [Solirubrobacteraceae bacterium]